MPEVNEHGQTVGDPVSDWTPRPRPEPVRLTGRYVTLDPLAASDTADLHAALCGPDDAPLWTYRTTPQPTSVEQVSDLVGTLLADPAVVTFVLRPLAGAAAGLASYLRVEPVSGSLEIGALLYARTLQRTPASTEAVHLLLRHAVDDLGYRRVEWKCDSLNEPSRRAAERLGFAYEGRFRRHLVVNGRNRDTDWFAITDADWPTVRAEHERWLDPANFDERGRQLSRLRLPR